jgi:TrpR family trp operon transcriptional repressor
MRSNSARGLHEIAEALAGIRDAGLIRRFLESILTPREREEIAGRWLLVQLLDRGESQRHAAKKLGMSLCKTTRGSRELRRRHSAFKAVLDQHARRHRITEGGPA